MRRSIATIAVVPLAVVLMAGCDTIEQETGLNRSTQEGAAGGAAFGGIIAALADANPAWIAASVVLGGVAGGAIGNALGKDDAETHAKTNLRALDNLDSGQTETWRNSSTGNSGSTKVTSVWQRQDGSECKNYVEIVHAGSQTETKDGTACRAPGGTWKVAAA